jgi:hypothetical protein
MWKTILKSLFAGRSSSGRRRGHDLPRGRHSGSRPSLEVLEARVTPSATFAQRAGGVGNDVGLAVATDDDGNVYVAGKIQGEVDVSGLNHALHLSGFGEDDAFVASWTPDGDIRWAKHLGGPYNDQASAIAVDHHGHVYVTGSFNGDGSIYTMPSPATFDQIVLPDAQTSYFGNGFVARMDAATGSVVWVTEADSYAGAGGAGIALDDAGNVYTTGNFANQVQFEVDTQGHFGSIIPSATGNASNSYLLKQDPDGNLIWVHRFGTTDGTTPDGALSTCIAVNGAGTSIYVGGSFQGHNVDFSTDGNPSLLLNSAGGSDLFVEKFDGSGSAVWAVRAGSPTFPEGLGETVSGVALDSQGNVYISGNFDGTADFGGLSLTASGGPDAVVARLDPTIGNFVWADALGGPGVDTATAIAVRAGHVYTTGYFTQTANFDPAGVYLLTSTGDADAFVSVLDTNGQFEAATQQGGSGRDEGMGIAVDHSGYIVTTGSFQQTAQFGPFSLTSAGGFDLFVYQQRLHCSGMAPFAGAGHDRGAGELPPSDRFPSLEGVWRFEGDPGWQHLNSANAAQVRVDDSGEVVGEFNGFGMGRYENGRSRLTPAAATETRLGGHDVGDGEFTDSAPWLDADPNP